MKHRDDEIVGYGRRSLDGKDFFSLSYEIGQIDGSGRSQGRSEEKPHILFERRRFSIAVDSLNQSVTNNREPLPWFQGTLENHDQPTHQYRYDSE